MSSFAIHKPASAREFHKPPFNFVPFSVHVTEFPNLNLTVAAVDTEDFDTSIIAGRIAATIDTLAQRSISRFAVNLSFGLVPCSVLEDFGAVKERYPTLEAYRDAILGKNGYSKVASFREELEQLLVSPVGAKPLQRLAQLDPNDFFEAEAVAYLASAGNYSMGYSLYPGAWPEFASVSASDMSRRPTDPLNYSHRDTYSNAGEILLPGGYYEFNLYYHGRGWKPMPGLAFAGTSFAAPVLSVFTALDFTSYAPRCPVTSDYITPLAFHHTYGVKSWQDVMLPDATSNFCP